MIIQILIKTLWCVGNRNKIMKNSKIIIEKSMDKETVHAIDIYGNIIELNGLIYYLKKSKEFDQDEWDSLMNKYLDDEFQAFREWNEIHENALVYNDNGATFSIKGCNYCYYFSIMRQEYLYEDAYCTKPLIYIGNKIRVKGVDEKGNLIFNNNKIQQVIEEYREKHIIEYDIDPWNFNYNISEKTLYATNDSIYLSNVGKEDIETALTLVQTLYSSYGTIIGDYQILLEQYNSGKLDY